MTERTRAQQMLEWPTAAKK